MSLPPLPPAGALVSGLSCSGSLERSSKEGEIDSGETKCHGEEDPSPVV